MDPRLQDSAFLRACRGEPAPHTPIWLNRQAGRYMPEYQQVKGSTPSLEFFKTPHLAAQVCCDAQRILGVDAAILFADLLPMLEPMGLALDYLPGTGPRIGNPVRTGKHIDALRLCPARHAMPYIGEAIALTRRELPPEIPLIGFAGAPFTLASYAVEGEGSRHYTQIKRLMHSDPGAFAALLDKMALAVADYLSYQIDCGVQTVQIFDSWVGALSVADYKRFALEPTRRLMQAVSGRVPVIHFGTGNPALLPLMQEAGGDVMALDWRPPLGSTWDALGCRAIQGNLDPAILLAPPEAMERAASQILAEAQGRPGHIFNLGHGILPETPVDNVKRLVNYVKSHPQP